MTTELLVDRPHMPPDYGPRKGLDGTLPWEWAETRLVAARNYWIATVTAGGAPHVAPVWGAWVADALWFGTSPQSAKGRHLARDDRVVAHLDSGDETVIVHGRARLVPVAELNPELVRAVDDAYSGKYVDQESGEPLPLCGDADGAMVYRVGPERVLGWLEQDFLPSRTRWHFPGA